jgi:4,4'-diaponeurosporenoate glycosyltransferase
MISEALFCALGLPAGFMLIWRVPQCAQAGPSSKVNFSIIIPARDEEENLPLLLKSIAASATRPAEVIVVDDGSTDRTAAIACKFGARVLTSKPRPEDWTGKCWACFQGAQQATGDVFLFLDADTYFVSGGLDRIIACWFRQKDRSAVVSLLPYHAMSAAYEQLSVFFNILMASGAGGFGASSKPRLFGQSLLIASETYFTAGGHAAVRGIVLENLRFARILRSAGARLLCLGGRGTLHTRMYPEGFRQMSESWAKALIQGASDSGGLILASSIVWISALWSTALMLVTPGLTGHLGLALVFALFCMQLAYFARQLGNYNLLGCLFYPLPLGYYCATFGRSAFRRALGRKTLWRGREV